MKKILFLLAMLPMFIFSACSDDDKSEVNPIVGTWKSYQMYLESPLNGQEPCWVLWEKDYYEFKIDNTYKFWSTYDGESKEGTYKIEGNKISIDGGFWHEIVFSSSNNELEFDGYRYRRQK